jgi:hypothetical protein
MNPVHTLPSYFFKINISIILQSTPRFQVKEDEMGRACSTNAYRILVEKPEGKRPLRRPKRRWVDNVDI